MPTLRRRPRQSGSPLTSDHPAIQALLAAFLEISPEAIPGMTRVLEKIVSMPKPLRAIYLLVTIPELSDREIARMVGVYRTKLYEWPEYKAAKARLRQSSPPHRGFRKHDGGLEAY